MRRAPGAQATRAWILSGFGASQPALFVVVRFLALFVLVRFLALLSANTLVHFLSPTMVSHNDKKLVFHHFPHGVQCELTTYMSSLELFSQSSKPILPESKTENICDTSEKRHDDTGGANGAQKRKLPPYRFPIADFVCSARGPNDTRLGSTRRNGTSSVYVPNTWQVGSTSRVHTVEYLDGGYRADVPTSLLNVHGLVKRFAKNFSFPGKQGSRFSHFVMQVPRFLSNMFRA